MRPLVFVAFLAALAVVLLLAGLHRGDPRPARTGGHGPRAGETLARAAGDPRPSEARAQVREFVAAFLAYEVGGGTAAKAAIRSHASPAFAHQLLCDPTTPAGRRGAGATRITSLRVARLPGRPSLTLVIGEADRPEGLEPFSFLFAHHAARWLAIAPGE